MDSLEHLLHHQIFGLKNRYRELWPLYGRMAVIILLFLLAACVTILFVSQLSRFLPASFRIADAEIARLVLTTIIGVMVTLIAVLFSALFVMQTVASTQFSPRLLQATIRYQSFQNFIGLCAGTLLYSALVFGFAGSGTGAVVEIGGAIGLVLLVVAVSHFAKTMIGLGQSMQINYIIHSVTEKTMVAIRERMGPRIELREEASWSLPNEWPPMGKRHEVSAIKSGYIQSIDYDELKRVALSEGVVVDICIQIGEYAMRGYPLMHVYSSRGVSMRLARKLLDEFYIDKTPTIEQDPEYGIRLLVDVALKAISPAVNDPSTAVTCMDHLEQLLIAASGRRDECDYLVAQGQVVIRRRTVSFRRLLDRACRQIRHYGKSDYAVTVRLLRLLSEVAEKAQVVEYLEPISEHARAVYGNLAHFGNHLLSDSDHDEIARRFEAVQITIAKRMESYPPTHKA